MMDKLDDGLCRLMRDKAPAEEVQQKFDELYRGWGRPVYRQFYVLYACYLVHHDYKDVELDMIPILTDRGQFSPLLTAVHERKSWFVDDEFLSDLLTDEHNKHGMFFKVFSPAFGIFDGDNIQTDLMTTVPDIIFLRDDNLSLIRFLPLFGPVERALLLRAARHGAKECCHILQAITKPAGVRTPAELLPLLLNDLFRISDITVENSLCTLQYINWVLPEYQSSSWLVEKDLDKIKEINNDILMIKRSCRSQSYFFGITNRLQSTSTGCDLELFSRVFIQICDSLLHLLTEDISYSSELNAFQYRIFYVVMNKLYVPQFSDLTVRNSIQQKHRIFALKLLNKLAKLCLQLGLDLAYKCIGYYFKEYDEIILAHDTDNDSDERDIALLLAEQLQVHMAYGQTEVMPRYVWEWFLPDRTVTEFHECLVEVIRLYVSLLPRREYHKLSNLSMYHVNQIEQALMRGDRTTILSTYGVSKVIQMDQLQPENEAARHQDTLDACRMWWKKECRSLKEICRYQLYQIFPRGTVPKYAQHFEISHTLKSYLSFGTDLL